HPQTYHGANRRNRRAGRFREKSRRRTRRTGEADRGGYAMSRLTDLKLEKTRRIVPRFDTEPTVHTMLATPRGLVPCVIPEPVSERLKSLEGEITASEKTGLEARWN